jgi:hypothetical protein
MKGLSKDVPAYSDLGSSALSFLLNAASLHLVGVHFSVN